MILLDANGLICALDATDPLQRRAAAAIRASRGPRLLSPFILAELDYLLTARVDRRVARRLLDEIAEGAYRLEPFDSTDVPAAAGIIDRFAGLDIGLADASIVVLAERHDVRDVLTLDERHFRALRADGKPFRILPADLAA
ncbi:MAG: PIN domain-containing protein [Chloroflexi bacterium]|nr:PIN domain-containing protein [Chloroflexota bacterium]